MGIICKNKFPPFFSKRGSNPLHAKLFAWSRFLSVFCFILCKTLVLMNFLVVFTGYQTVMLANVWQILCQLNISKWLMDYSTTKLCHFIVHQSMNLYIFSSIFTNYLQHAKKCKLNLTNRQILQVIFKKKQEQGIFNVVQAY